MISVHGRKPAAVIVEPVARALVGVGISPNTVTVVGTGLAVAVAAVLIPSGHLFAAAVLLAFLTATDMVDGTMARLRGGGTRFGATLDASCDRITDGAIFAALAVYFSTGPGASRWLLICTLVTLVAGQVTSYVKARAEASGIKVIGGLIERPERVILSVTSMGLAGLGVTWAFPAGMLLLVAGSCYTVVQRLVTVAQSDMASQPIDAPEGAREFGKSRLPK